jgi:spermidine/putrescine transport system ATP-binding protein
LDERVATDSVSVGLTDAVSDEVATAAVAGCAVELRAVTKSYGGAVAVDDCSLAIRRHEFLSLLGPSGCGKTTILKMIGGFLQPDAGEIRINGKEMTDRPPNKRPVNTVFQSYALFPHMSVLENVMFPLEVGRAPKRERRERAREALELVRMLDHAERAPADLSGGQAQRVALARALVGRPEVLLLDEPLSALDLKLRKAMQVELRRIHDETGTTFIFVTHDQGEALAMSDRIVLMSAGRIVQAGHPRTLYDEPTSAFASDFLGAANLLRGEVIDRAGGLARVRCGMLDIGVRTSGEIVAGATVDVSIRPERLRLCEIDAPSQAMGVIKSVTFLGNVVHCSVDVGAHTPLSVEQPREVGDRWQEGDRVGVTWPPEAALLFETGSAA